MILKQQLPEITPSTVTTTTTTPSHLCDDLLLHIFSFIDMRSLFRSMYQVNRTFHSMTLRVIDSYITENGQKFQQWFLSYGKSQFVPYSSLFDEKLLIQERTENMRRLAQTYDTMYAWMRFMKEIGHVVAPRMLFRVVHLHNNNNNDASERTKEEVKKFESENKEDEEEEEGVMFRQKTLQQCSQLLQQCLNVTFVLDHLKMIQFLPMNDMSILKRLEHTFKQEHDPTYVARTSRHYDENTSLIKTELCGSFNVLFEKVKMCGGCGEDVSCGGGDGGERLYQLLNDYVLNVLPATTPALLQVKNAKNVESAGKKTQKPKEKKGELQLRRSSLVARKLRSLASSASSSSSSTTTTATNNNNNMSREQRDAVNIVTRTCLLAIASFSNTECMNEKRMASFLKSIKKQYPHLKQMEKQLLMMDHPHSMLYSPQFFLSKCERQISTRHLARLRAA